MARKVRRSSGRRISPLGWAAIGCGSVVGLGLLAMLVGWLLVVATPAPPPEAAHSGSPTSGGRSTPSGTAASQPGAPPPSSTAPSATEAPPLEVQLHQVETASRSDQPVQVRLVITQDALNSLVAQHATGDVQDPQVYFGEGTIVTTGIVTWRGQKLQFTVRGHPVVSGGDVNVVVDHIDVGRLPAPAQLYDQAATRINRGLDELLARERFQAESVQVTPGVMTVTGRAGGRR